MNDKIFNLLSEFGPNTFNIKSFFIYFFVRIFIFLIALIIYFYVLEIIPKDLKFRHETALVATLIICIVFFISSQERLEIYLKKKFLSEYLFDDPLSLKLAYKKFEVDNLIANVFPDMINISGVGQGKILILRKSGNYDAYSYTQGKRKKIKANTLNISKGFVNFLKEKKQCVTLADALANEEINENFNILKADYVLPFIYREKVFGLLALSGNPDTIAQSHLNILASKSAVAIYNHILSSQVAIHAKYKKEFEVANKIEEMIFKTRLPKFNNIEFNNLKEDPNILLEFFKNEENEHYFILLTLQGKNKYSTGLVLSHMFGKYYSQSVIKKRHTHKSLKELTELLLKELDWNDDYEFLIGNFFINSSKMTFLQQGSHFKVTTESKTESQISIGWKATIDIANEIYYIQYKNNNILSIRSI